MQFTFLKHSWNSVSLFNMVADNLLCHKVSNVSIKQNEVSISTCQQYHVLAPRYWQYMYTHKDLAKQPTCL